MSANLFDNAQRHLNKTALEESQLLSGAFWAELRVFLAVAKMKSFNRAAQALGMSQPTVSRHVKRLQDVLGAQLILSARSGITLTPRGRDLARTLADLDRQLGAISDDLKLERSDAEGLVRIQTTEALAGLFIAPNLHEFTDRHPRIRLHIANPTNMTALRENHTDVLVNFSPESGVGVQSTRGGTVHLMPLVSRTYVERCGMPTTVNLESHCFVDTSYYMGDSPVWAPWRALVARSHRVHACDNSFAYGLMVQSGVGVGLLANYAMAAEGAMAPVLDVHIRLPLFAHAMADRLASRPVRIVYDWLTDLFSERSVWFGADPIPSEHQRDALAPVVARAISRR